MTSGSFWMSERRSFGDPASAIEHHYLIRDLHHESHVVLDNHQGDAVIANPVERLRQSLRLRVVETRCRLIKQHQPRSRGKTARDLEQTPQPVRHVGSRSVAPLVEPDEAQQTIGLLGRQTLLLQRPRKSHRCGHKTRMRCSVRPDHDVLVRCHLLEQLRVLECPRDTRTNDTVGSLHRSDSSRRN